MHGYMHNRGAYRRPWQGPMKLKIPKDSTMRAKVRSQTLPLRFESTQALFKVADKAIAVERACGLKKLANISHWGNTGDVQLMYLDQVDALLRTTLDCANHATPLTANDIAQRLAEGLLRIESLARSDATDTDGYATASIWRVRASLFAQRRSSTSWVRSVWRKLHTHN